MTQSLKQAPLCTSSALHRVPDPSWGDPSPHMSFLKQFPEGLGALSAPFFHGTPLSFLGKAYKNCQPPPTIFFTSCFPFPSCLLPLTMDLPAAPVHKAQSSSYRNKDLTDLVLILCATRYKQHLYHFSSLCVCNLLVARLSRLRSPPGTADRAGRATVRP